MSAEAREAKLGGTIEQLEVVVIRAVDEGGRLGYFGRLVYPGKAT